ncbi:hypothetical protein [Okibacterium endophyticum]
MGDFLPNGGSEPHDPKKPSRARVVLWVVGAGAGLYLIGSGLVGILSP